jgi:hypothetical protein
MTRRAASLLLAVTSLYGCRRAAAPAPARPLERGGVTTAIKLDHFGYRPLDVKVAVFSADPGPTVEVRTPAGTHVFTVPTDGGSIVSKGADASSGDRIWWVDFTPLEAPGAYDLYSPSLGARSYTFVLAPDVYAGVMRAALKTFYRQRCGLAKPARYAGAWSDPAACHTADAATAAAHGQRDRGRRNLAGGWHDAGDYNKYVWYAASNAVLFLIGAWEDDAPLVPDGALDIPESGNGISDLLDEVKWELDFFLSMQLPDGSALFDVHAEGSASGASPPSADATPRYYRDPTPDSGAVLAGSCALASRVFAAAGRAEYAAALGTAARAAWTWLEGRGDSDQKVWAAAEVFRMDPTIASARRYVDGYRGTGWSAVPLASTSYAAHAAITYVRTAAATPAVVSDMRAAIGREVDAIFAADDLYRNGMPLSSYHWGSNASRAGHGVFLLQAARLDATGSHSAADCERHALDILHFFHGQNPLSMVYLTNMAAWGGEHSSWQIFHDWFGQVGSRHSRARHVGKPPFVVEPHYPYFEGTDNHGVQDDKASALGPAPGFVPGGPNRGYSGDAVPPAGARGPNLFYRDWNDQSTWTARTWEITETSIGYQGPYVALVARFAACGRPRAGAPC